MGKVAHEYEIKVLTDTEYECVLKVPMRGRALERVVVLSRSRALKKKGFVDDGLASTGITTVHPSLFGLVNSGITPIVSEVRKAVADMIRVLNWRVVGGSYHHSQKVLTVIVRGDYVDAK